MNGHKEERDISTTINDVLTRGVGELIDPKDSFKEKLLAKAQGTYSKDIIIKFGVDVTRPDIHLGHAVVLRKLRQFQDLGCKIVFLIGDFTTLIGDPTGKSKVRPEIDQKEIEKNVRTYLDQVDKVLLVNRDPNGDIIDGPRFTWMRNSDWFYGVTDISVEGAGAITIENERKEKFPVPSSSFLAKAVLYENTRMQKSFLKHSTTYGVSFVNLLSILRHISFAQLIERDMFQDRIKGGEPLFVHEMLYPIIQGADSNVMADIYGSCDLEIGGTDQVFNMLMGRRVMEIAQKEPQAVMGMKLLVGLDGKDKMSKSLDNYISLLDSPEEMYGKVMSIPDQAMVEYFELATYTTKEEIERLLGGVTSGATNPRDAKMALARQIVEIYHGRKEAETAEKQFIQTFQEKRVPEDVRVLRAKLGTPLSEILVGGGIIPSKSEFRRLVDARAIKVGGTDALKDPYQKFSATMTLKIGKHEFLRIEAL